MSENYADEIDRANHLAEIANESAVADARRVAGPEQEQNADGTWPTLECVECGEPIELGRLQLGRVRCFECQNEIEKRKRRYAR